MAITQDEINRLKAPFPLEAHSIREGNRTKSGKIQWFVYMEKTEVENRLNEVFMGEWGSTQPVLTVIGNNVAATIGITIRGITRGNTGEDSNGQEKAKGATTDAFRRAAADWGVAKYLWEMEEMIYTDGYENSNWDQQKQRKTEAFGKFKAWYQKKFGNYKPPNISKFVPESHQEVHTGVSSPIPAQSTTPPQPTAESAKSALGTPNGQRMGGFTYERTKMFLEVGKVVNEVSTPERNNTVIAMEGEGAFKSITSYQQGVDLVIARLNSPEHGKSKKAQPA